MKARRGILTNETVKSYLGIGFRAIFYIVYNRLLKNKQYLNIKLYVKKHLGLPLVSRWVATLGFVYCT